METLQNYMDKASTLFIQYGLSLVQALLVLFIGLWIIKKVMKTINKNLGKRNVDESLRPFLISIIGALLKIMLIISVASMLGIAMTSFVAVLGAAGLAVGFALQGSLSNFAGGVLILLLKPFKVGDFIEADGITGTVREIQIFYTYITTVTNEEIIVPNGNLSNGSVKNYSFHDTRRVDMTFGIGYSDDIDKAKSILVKLVEEDSRVLKDPAMDIFVSELADSSVNFRVRMWVNAPNYWPVNNVLNEKVKKAFDAAGVSIPFPQTDVHLFKEG